MKNAIASILFVLIAASLFAGTDSKESNPAGCPMHEQHMKAAAATHGAEVDSRHDTLVASHETTRHSFRLFSDGGAIELRARDLADEATIDGVRTHLQEIAAQFAANDFGTPAFVHGREPAGVAGMQQLHDAIQFRYESLDGGGRIRMTTANPDALASIHDFLKFQVVEHRTKDPGVVEQDK